MKELNSPIVVDAVERAWKENILPVLGEYIKLPNLSPGFDKEWEKKGYMEEAVRLFASWAEAFGPRGSRVEVHRVQGKTPLLLLEAPATDGSDRTVVIYGHLDKQPECALTAT